MPERLLTETQLEDQRVLYSSVTERVAFQRGMIDESIENIEYFIRQGNLSEAVRLTEVATRRQQEVNTLLHLMKGVV